VYIKCNNRSGSFLFLLSVMLCMRYFTGTYWLLAPELNNAAKANVLARNQKNSLICRYGNIIGWLICGVQTSVMSRCGICYCYGNCQCDSYEKRAVNLVSLCVRISLYTKIRVMLYF